MLMYWLICHYCNSVHVLGEVQINVHVHVQCMHVHVYVQCMRHY